jgi:hypothetical protein
MSHHSYSGYNLYLLHHHATSLLAVRIDSLYLVLVYKVILNSVADYYINRCRRLCSHDLAYRIINRTHVKPNQNIPGRQKIKID